MKPHTDRILIVDTNEMNRDMLARRLARKGYDVLVANGAHDLVEASNRMAWIGVADIEMPEITGSRRATHIAKVYSAAELPVIMVTRRTKRGHHHALDLGANDT